MEQENEGKTGENHTGSSREGTVKISQDEHGSGDGKSSTNHQTEEREGVKED